MNNLKFYPFPSIEQFRQVVSSVKRSDSFNNRDTDNTTLTFQGTVKLHGTNAGIILDREGNYYAQSRNNVLSIEKDNAGFAAFALQPQVKLWIQPLLQSVLNRSDEYVSVALYGEWAGQGIQKGVAVSEVEKFFAPFALCFYTKSEKEGVDYERNFLPDNLLDLYKNEALRIFPVTMDLLGIEHIEINFSELSLANISNELAQKTLSVEECDPFAKYYFGVEGVGEGVVWKLVDTKGIEQYGNLIFKVKGEKHSISKVKTIAPVNVERIEKITEFVEYACTENRLNQGLDYLKEQGKELDQTSTGDFIKWVMNDILKEESDVLLENGLTWKNVQGMLAKKAQTFYKSKAF
ncbi:MAG: RNA ligase family protein [Streptobacillus sp.]